MLLGGPAQGWWGSPDLCAQSQSCSLDGQASGSTGCAFSMTGAVCLEHRSLNFDYAFAT